MTRWTRLTGILMGVSLVAGLCAPAPVGEAPQATLPPAPAATEAPAQEATEAPAEEAHGVTLKMILVAPAERWEFMLPRAEAAVEKANPGLDLTVDANILPFGDRLTQLRSAAVAGTPLDLVSLDQPEVGEFAAAGFTTNLTPLIESDLNGLEDWLPAHRAATLFQGEQHAIWAWTDARVMWYWKDLVEEAGVDPASDMTTWQGYLDACQKLDEALAGQGIEGCLLIGQPWIADWTYPYVWMNGGQIGLDVDPAVAGEAGAKEAWVPTFDDEAWVRALEFTRDQVEVGIDPFTEHQFGPAFVSRRFATFLDGTWVFGGLTEAGVDMSQVGMLGWFPVPEEGDQTATMAGGWTLAIPATSENPDVAWQFLKALLAQEILGQMQAEFGYLPTQESFARDLAGEYEAFWNKGGVDRWSELQKIQEVAYGRPSFPSWPEVSDAITTMVQQVMFEGASPEEATAEAQRTVVVDVLGWPEGTAASLQDNRYGCEGREVGAVVPGQQAADENGDGLVCVTLEVP